MFYKGGLKIKKMRTINLCKGCIEDLKEYNPYVDDNGVLIPLNELTINEVPLEQCDNYLLGVITNE